MGTERGGASEKRSLTSAQWTSPAFQPTTAPLLTSHLHQPQDTVIAIRKGGTKLSVANVESDKYPLIEFDTDPKQASSRR